MGKDLVTDEITVIMPAYNAERLLPATLDSILLQTYKNWHLIVVNDGSTDKTADILDEYSSKYKNIEYITIKNTGSARIPRLKAASLSNSEWICNIDSDDIIESTYLEKLVIQAKKTNSDIVSPTMHYTTFEGEVFNQVPDKGFDFNQVLTGKDAAFLTFKQGSGSMIACNGMLCRKELYDELLKDVTSSSYVYQDEVDFFFILLRANRVAFSDAKYTYFKNDNSVTHTPRVKTYDKLLTEIKYNQLIKREYTDNSIIRLGNARFLQTLFARRIKYLKEKHQFNKTQQEEINQMFRMAFHHIDLNARYPLMKKIMLVFGTRPEAIKMAPLVKEFQKFPKEFETIVCVTGQHREMLDQVLRIFEIRPDYDLDIMKQGQDLYDVTARVLTGMRDVLKEAQPDVVLVHGDTTTSTASALAAFYQQIPVGHIEAGLRTHNIYSPWPEEMNRLITGRIATYHFSPTPLSRQNLLAEGIKEEAITVTGNTVIDALYWVVEKIKNNKFLSVELGSFLKTAGYDVNRLNDNRRLVLITGHRRENFGDGFIHMCLAIKNLVEKYPQVDFVYPMHLNPNVRKPIHEVFGETTADNMFFIEPLEYLSFVYLMEKSDIVLTDSGGIQEEAPGLGKPVLVMRDTTERPEALEAGTVKLVGTDYDKIVGEVSALLDDPVYYDRMSKAVNPYGDGKACKRIVAFLNK